MQKLTNTMKMFHGFTDRRYVNCVSLGWYCGVASQLSKLGLRSQSGPFDWCLSYYQSVLDQIEHNFQDFLNLKNLALDEDDKSNRTFIDKKYGFSFHHDIQNDFKSEYGAIKLKYDRRIVVFRKSIMQPTAFFRCVRDQDEVNYINENWEKAQILLKSFNNDNCVIYVYRKGLNGLTNKVWSFALGIDEYIGKIYEMRHIFDGSDELGDLCNRLLDYEVIQSNILFDRKTNTQKVNAAIVNKCIKEGINGIDRIILDSLNATYSTGIYIWGAGEYGIPLVRYLKERGVVIKGLIDNNLSNDSIQGIDICPFDSVEHGAKIFIAVSDKDANKSIMEQILNTNKSTIISKYLDLSEKELSIIISNN